MNTHQNLAARMARWSARHRKRAFWGWIAFVIAAFAIGNMVGSTPISDVDQWSGESHDAEAALDRAGLRPTSEVVFLQSDRADCRGPGIPRRGADVARRLPQVDYVKNVESPLDGGAVTQDRHAALVDFEIAGDSVEARDRVDAVLAAVARMQSDHPNVNIEQFGDASANKAVNDTVSDDLKAPGCCRSRSR